jgi:hypothetical protein
MRGDPVQALEKLWSATAEMVKAVALSETSG